MKTGRIIILIIASFSFKLQAQIIGLNTCNQAPELNFWNQDSTKQIALSSLKGKLVLVDFWASWCGPCRLENPYLVNTYKTFKNKTFGNANGFEIYSVSLDYDRTRWIQAINHDSLCWHTHVSDLKGWDSQAALVYSINAIPSNFLLDENGIIIGENFRGYNGKLDSVLNLLSESPANNPTLKAQLFTLQVYPNPTASLINLEISYINDCEIQNIAIYNSMGENLKQLSFQNLNLTTADSAEIYYHKAYCTQRQIIKLITCQIETSNLPAGIYTVEILSSKGVINRKVAIIK